jgi:hypothetical protein
MNNPAHPEEGYRDESKTHAGKNKNITTTMNKQHNIFANHDDATRCVQLTGGNLQGGLEANPLQVHPHTNSFRSPNLPAGTPEMNSPAHPEEGCRDESNNK